MSKEIKWYKRTDYTKEKLIELGARNAIYYYKGYDDTYGNIEYTERILINNKFEYIENNCIANQSEPIDILEIQDYLPTNHPDRIVGLPEEYIVECNSNSEYCLNVYSNFYKDEFDPTGWKYIVCSPKINTAQFENKGIYPSGWCIRSTINTLELKDLPVFTYEQWLKLKDMNKEFKVPERWCINDNTEEEVIKWFENYNHGSYSGNTNAYLHYPKIDGYCYFKTIQEGYTEITFEQFRKYILNNNTKTMERKIKGYKCPTDLWNGDISKGTLYVKKGNKNYGISGDISDNFNMPKEIVEQWEVVYEDEFKVGDWVVIIECEFGAKGAEGFVGKITKSLGSNGKSDIYPNGVRVDINGKVWTIGKNYNTVKLRLATPEEIKSAQTKTIAVGESKKIMVTIHKGKIVTESQTLNIELFTDLLDVMNGENCLAIANWDVTFPTVKIGCTTLPKSDIELIINTYNSLNE